MRLYIDFFNDLVSSKYNTNYPEFRQRDWGFYYLKPSEIYRYIKMCRIYEPKNRERSKYYL